MRERGLTTKAWTALLLLASSAAPAFAAAPRGAELVEAVTEAAAGVVTGDRARVDDATQRAAEDIATWLAEGASPATARRLGRAAERLARTQELLATPDASRRTLLRQLELAGREALHANRRAAMGGASPYLAPLPHGSDGVRRGGTTIRLVVRGTTDAAITLSFPDGASPAIEDVTTASRNRARVRTSGATGAARIEVGSGADTAVLWIVTRGAREDLEGPLSALEPPATVTYGAAPLRARVGEAIAPLSPSLAGTTPDGFAVAPPLPAGLQLDALTGTITGSPINAAFEATFVITATSRSGATQADLVVEITPSVPAEVAFLAPGLVAERLFDVPGVPVKLAFLPDGRLIFNELTTGNVRITAFDGTLRPTPVATLPVLTGGERGLLGIAVAPDFATTGHVTVFASTAADGVHADRNRILRLTLEADLAVATEVLVDDLPVGHLSNGGHVAYGPDGHLWVTIGDTGVETLAQTDGVRAGRLLRFTADGGVPADNPVSDDPEWCRGLRNPFGLAFHAATGGAFLSENGPTAHDELNFVQREKNFEWGPVPPSLPDFARGFRIIDWTPVIVPTGIAFASTGRLAPIATRDDLLLGSYDHAEVRRLRLSGALLTDLDDESVLIGFTDPEEIANKPLDVVEAPDGAIYVSTFGAIWRVDRYAP